MVRVSFFRLFFFFLRFGDFIFLVVVVVVVVVGCWWLEVGGYACLGHMGCVCADFWFLPFCSSNLSVMVHDWLEHTLSRMRFMLHASVLLI